MCDVAFSSVQRVDGTSNTSESLQERPPPKLPLEVVYDFRMIVALET